MASDLSQDVFYDYLYSINPIAVRIGKDVDATKEAYQSLWYDLSVDEQNKILEESLISPDTVLKYSKYRNSEETKEKVSIGEFSWFTRSQLDLCSHVDSVRENFSANDCKTTVKRLISKEKQDNKLINEIKSNALFKSLMPVEEKTKIIKSDKTKPKGPPPPPPQVVTIPKPNVRESSIYVYNDDDNDDDADIPKTGFDFLDNW